MFVDVLQYTNINIRKQMQACLIQSTQSRWVCGQAQSVFFGDQTKHLEPTCFTCLTLESDFQKQESATPKGQLCLQELLLSSGCYQKGGKHPQVTEFTSRRLTDTEGIPHS